MSGEMKILLFGDQALDTRSYIQNQLIVGRTNPILYHFLNRVGVALRYEVSQLPPVERNRIPIFSTIEELVDRTKSECTSHQGIQSALLCISQLAHYIEYAGDISGQSNESSQTCLVGLCTGLLAAAAIASSPAPLALIPLAIEVVLIAFRTGSYIGATADRLELPREGSVSWSTIVTGTSEIEVQGALDNLHKTKAVIASNHAYISAMSNGAITISGPPSTLEQLFNSTSIGTKRLAVPIYGPYHASHLHGTYDIDQILRTSDSRIANVLDQYTPRIPLMSTSNRSWFDEKTTTQLFEAVLDDILNQPLRLTETFMGCVDAVLASKSTLCRVIPCGPTNASISLVTALKSKTSAQVILHDVDSQTPSGLQRLNQAPRTSRRPKLAIVGMGGRFPNAEDHEKFWDLLYAGMDLHRKVPADRFDVDKHYDPTGKKRNTSHTPFGCFIDNPGYFDPRFFNMSPREATQTDPMHRLGLTTAYEALEMAGYVPNRTPSTKLDRIGTFYGQTSDDWREINAAQEIDTYFITGGVRAFAPGRINYYFKFSGPSFSVDTACSSSAAAIQIACTSLWAGECDTAVAGGLNVMTNSDIFAGLSRGQFLSKTGNCQTYDNDADGYCRGDGIGSLVIKRLEDAEADNDRILGVILETATNHSANAVSITHPHAPTQEYLFKKVMDEAGVDPHDVTYVEMHGTGTQAGDGTEMKSVTNVFAPVARKGTRKQSLHLGTVKSNAGHGEAVSGVTALIKCLMMLQKNTIPPHCGVKKSINQGFPTDLQARNVHIAFKPTPLVSVDGSPRRIFVNNFSAAGGNTAILLEDPPQKLITRSDPRSDWVVAVSAKSKSALKANTSRLIEYLDINPGTSVADLSYTTTARRIQHNYRIAFSCGDVGKAKEILSSKLDDLIDPVSNIQPTVAFAFTGQGSHYTALGKQLFQNSNQFRTDITDFNNISCGQGFPSFMSLIQGDVDVKNLSPLVVQIGICCIQMALTRLWASWGIKPSVVIGHSLGEYAALNAAGVISTSEAIYLVGERAKLLQGKCTASSHAMLATKASAQSCMDMISEISGVEIACINGPQETVLSGTVENIDEAVEALMKQGIKCTKLNVPYAFHSSQVDVFLKEFEQVAVSVTFRKPTMPIISPLLSSVLGEMDTIDGEYLSRHAREAVNFTGGIAAAQQSGVVNDKTVWVEIGPHPVCMGFVKSALGQTTITAPSLRKDTSPYKTITTSLAALHNAGLAVDWNEYHRDFVDCLQMLNLPAYAFDNKKYWIQYTGNWNLSKGQAAGLPAIAETAKSTLSTTTVQKVISEEVNGDKASMVVESEVSDPKLLAAISGHIVNGTALCPSSIYGDMALTVGDHLYKLARPSGETIGMNVCRMEVFKSFIADTSSTTTQVIRLSAKMDLATNGADLIFTSGSGKSEVQHAKCRLEYGSNAAWLAEWNRNAYLISGRVDTLKKSAAEGKAHRMLRGMAYKLFTALVDYDSKYKGMEEVLLDSPQLEATSKVVFQTTEADGNFFCSPYWIDSVAHLAGFVVNANDALDSSQQVYISHGWESMRFAEPLKADKTYQSYVKMQPAGKDVMAGDVFVFDGDRIIGCVAGLKFQCIPRRLLNTFLPPKGAVAQRPASAPVASRPAPKAPAPKPAKSVATKAAVQSAGPSIVVKAFDIIATEVGMPVSELADAIEFASIGVDSLMSLTISGRMREDLEIDVQSSAFNDYPTAGELKAFLARQYGASEVLDMSVDDSDEASTPSLDSESGSSQGDTYTQATTPGSPGSPGSPSESESLSTIIRETICAEMGVEMAELLGAEDLSSLGLDSLMGLSILGVLREKTGLSLPATLLIDNPSIKAVERELHVGPPEKKPEPKPTSVAAKMPEVRVSHKGIPERFATSVLLQGSSRTAEKTLWLIPDGSGSATSYMFMPELSKKVVVYGLNSPFMKTPEEYDCGVAGMAAKFIQEIKRRQPQGPYNIGGWSAGGVISFETVRQLIEGGDKVDVLALIDTPCPLIIEPLPASLHRFFGEIGLLGDGEGALEKLPAWLLPHFAASVRALSTYTAKKIPANKCPKVMAIWCEDGVCKFPDDRRPDPYPYGHAQWLLENRTDFGPNLWDEYLSRDKIICRQMTGNHFNMMRDPYVAKLSEFLREALL